MLGVVVVEADGEGVYAASHNLDGENFNLLM